MNAFTKFEMTMLETVADDKTAAAPQLDVGGFGSDEFTFVLGGGVVGNFD